MKASQTGRKRQWLNQRVSFLPTGRYEGVCSGRSRHAVKGEHQRQKDAEPLARIASRCPYCDADATLRYVGDVDTVKPVDLSGYEGDRKEVSR